MKRLGGAKVEGGQLPPGKLRVVSCPPGVLSYLVSIAPIIFLRAYIRLEKIDGARYNGRQTGRPSIQSLFGILGTTKDLKTVCVLATPAISRMPLATRKYHVS
jgi:hypothetical protein